VIMSILSIPIVPAKQSAGNVPCLEVRGARRCPVAGSLHTFSRLPQLSRGDFPAARRSFLLSLRALQSKRDAKVHAIARSETL
jgi:hypothetical protein